MLCSVPKPERRLFCSHHFALFLVFSLPFRLFIAPPCVCASEPPPRTTLSNKVFSKSGLRWSNAHMYRRPCVCLPKTASIFADNGIAIIPSLLIELHGSIHFPNARTHRVRAQLLPASKLNSLWRSEIVHYLCRCTRRLFDCRCLETVHRVFFHRHAGRFVPSHWINSFKLDAVMKFISNGFGLNSAHLNV